MSPPALEVRRLVASFGDVKVLCCLDLVIEKGEIVTIVGQNGSGKTTLLRAICGLHEIDSTAMKSPMFQHHDAVLG